MRKNSLLFFLLLINCLSSVAQADKRDSLMNLLKTAKPDTGTVFLYLNIGEQFEGTEPAVAKTWYQKAIELSNRLDFKTGIIKSFTYYGGMCSAMGESDSAILYGEKSLAVAREVKDSLNIGLSLLNIGVVYGYRSEFETAVKYCLQGLNVVEGKTYAKTEAQINDRLQVLYMQMSQYDKAIAYGDKAVLQARQLKMKNLLAQSLSNLSMSYIGKKMPEQAKPLLAEALKLARELKDQNMEASMLLNLAGMSMDEGDYENLKTLSERSLVLQRRLGSLDGQATSLRAIGIYYLHRKNYDSAVAYAEQSIGISKTNNLKSEYASGLKLMSNISFAKGNLDEGDKYYGQSEAILTEMIKGVLSESSANLEKKYETDKKDNQLKLQRAEINKKNVYNYMLIGGAITILFISLLLFRTYQQKQKLQQQRINELETLQQLTATEAVLKGEEQERTRLARDLHDGLGGMLSGIKYSFNTMKGNLIMTPENALAFERSMDMLDSSIKEMRRVAHNMMPEALVKFGLDTALKDLCNDINQSGALQVAYQSIGMEAVAIEQTTAITIYRIVQELLNNTMKHAGAKTALVQLTKTDGRLSVTVEDDGKGFDKSVLNQSKGIGWSNIQNRVEFLKGSLDVQTGPESGTSVFIEFTV